MGFRRTFGYRSWGYRSWGYGSYGSYGYGGGGSCCRILIFLAIFGFLLSGILLLTLWYLPGQSWNADAKSTTAQVVDHYYDTLQCSGCCSTLSEAAYSTTDYNEMQVSADTTHVQFNTNIPAPIISASTDQEPTLANDDVTKNSQRGLLWTGGDYYYSDYYDYYSSDTCPICYFDCYKGGVKIMFDATDPQTSLDRQYYGYDVVTGIHYTTSAAMDDAKSQYPLGTYVDIWYQSYDPNDWRWVLYDEVAALATSISMFGMFVLILCWLCRPWNAFCSNHYYDDDLDKDDPLLIASDDQAPTTAPIQAEYNGNRKPTETSSNPPPYNPHYSA